MEKVPIELDALQFSRLASMFYHFLMTSALKYRPNLARPSGNATFWLVNIAMENG
jgi:hypothetical protein